MASEWSGKRGRACQAGVHLCATRRCKILDGSVLGCVRHCMRPRLCAPERGSL